MNKQQFRELKHGIMLVLIAIIGFQMFFHGKAQDDGAVLVLGGIIGIIGLLGARYYLVSKK